MAVNFPDSPSNGDNFTANGIVYIYNSTKGVWAKQSTTAPPVVTGHVLPNANETYDLGSLTQRFRDIYLSGNTLYLGGTALSVDENGNLGLPAGTVIDGATIPSAVEELSDIDVTINNEIFTLNVDSPDAGHGSHWKWTWDAGTVAYSRLKIVNLVQSNIPLYNQGIYTLNNFAAHELHGSMTQTHKIYLKWIEGAGIDNLVSWAVITDSVTGVTNPNINGGSATEVQRIVISVPSTVTLPTLNTPSVSYDVSFVSAGAYAFTGVASGDNPDIGPFYRGGTYTFNLDASLSGHPFYLTTDDGTNFSTGNYVGEYTSGVTGSRNESGTLVFTVPNDAPDTLYYQCGNHNPMRGMITIKDLAVETNVDNNYVLYFQHDQDGHSTPVEIRPKRTLADIDNVCLVYDGPSGKFKVQDMGEYLDSTSQFQSKIANLVNTETADKPTTAQVTDKIKDETVFNINMHQGGDLQVITGTKRWYSPFDLQISGISANLGTAADNIVGIDVKNNGVSAKTVSFSPNTTTTNVVAPFFTMSAGDYLTVDITSIGTNSVGQDLYLQFTYKKV
jgi:hypothetical protein